MLPIQPLPGALPPIQPLPGLSSDISVHRQAGGGYNLYNWTTGDDYTVKPKANGRWNAYNWTTGDDYDIRIRPGGRSAEIYNWRDGTYTDVDR